MDGLGSVYIYFLLWYLTVIVSGGHSGRYFWCRSWAWTLLLQGYSFSMGFGNLGVTVVGIFEKCDSYGIDEDGSLISGDLLYLSCFALVCGWDLRVNDFFHSKILCLFLKILCKRPWEAGYVEDRQVKDHNLSFLTPHKWESA